MTDTTTQLRNLALLLAHLRTHGRVVPVTAAEALLLIASGIDHRADLAKAMQDAEGRPLSASTCDRIVALLRGGAKYHAQAGWVESPFSLVEIRKHPHRQGAQIMLSENGKALITAFFPHAVVPLQLEPQ